MTKIIQIRKKYICVYLISILVLPIISVLLINGMKDSNKRGKISNFETARLLMMGIATDDELAGMTKPEDYLDALNESGCCTMKDGQAELTYRNVKSIFEYYVGEVSEQISVLNDNRTIARESFLKLYCELLPHLPHGSELMEGRLTIAGIKKMSDDTYKLYTPQGIFTYYGSDMNLYEDQTYVMMFRGDEALFVQENTDDESFTQQNESTPFNDTEREPLKEKTIAVYNNVLLMNCTGKNGQFNLYGYVRDIDVKGLDESLKNVLCNIKVKAGRVISIDLKLEQISGKVLSVTKEYVDVEGYGHVALDEEFLMYDTLNYESVTNYEGIVVGYSLQNFIVAQGKICGAVKESRLNAANIRVMLMSTGYKSLFHEQVIISSAEGFSVNSDDESRHYNGGEEVIFARTDESVNGRRVRIIPDGTNELTVKSINRSQGNPQYSGILEVECYGDGLVLINDVNMEEYVSHVIPSEMPASFGLEALKVQAICARSYAYKELTNTNYSMYGAHVDDSVQCQVYNNTADNQLAKEAAKQTCGQLLMYKDEVVQTYYYSTSCGVTADVSLWGSDASKYPYYSSVSVGEENHSQNMYNEADFHSFITNSYQSDYDSEFPLYRWNMTVDCHTLGESISAKTGCNIGDVTGITVNKRVSGGAAVNITITGSQGSTTLSKESYIRTCLGNGNVDLNTQNGTVRYERLPSTFITFVPQYNENGQVNAFTIYGGGYGHGIGMSQNAVKAMSQKMNYVQILQFFYKGTEVKTALG